MKNFSISLFAVCLMLLSVVSVNAQIQTPAASPTATLKQTVGLTEVTIEYSRPGLKDRKAFAADGLAPFGKAWRTGANSATKFTFSEGVKIGGQELKGGAYAVLSKPGASEWEVMFFPYEAGNWMSYLEKTPAATVKVKPVNLGMKMETFTINIGNVRNTGATIDLMWENTAISLPVEVSVDEKVMAQINRVLNGPSANDYFAAASYYHDAGKDLKQAHAWIVKANATNPQYWTLRRQSLIEADLGMVKEAIATANKSKELAQKANDDAYIRMNEASIAEWTKKMK